MEWLNLNNLLILKNHWKDSLIGQKKNLIVHQNRNENERNILMKNRRKNIILVVFGNGHYLANQNVRSIDCS